MNRFFFLLAILLCCSSPSFAERAWVYTLDDLIQMQDHFQNEENAPSDARLPIHDYMAGLILSATDSHDVLRAYMIFEYLKPEHQKPMEDFFKTYIRSILQSEKLEYGSIAVRRLNIAVRSLCMIRTESALAFAACLVYPPEEWIRPPREVTIRQDNKEQKCILRIESLRTTVFGNMCNVHDEWGEKYLKHFFDYFSKSLNDPVRDTILRYCQYTQNEYWGKEKKNFEMQRRLKEEEREGFIQSLPYDIERMKKMKEEEKNKHP